VKEWAKAHKINNSKTGSFNSFTLSLLVIFHLQVPLCFCIFLCGDIFLSLFAFSIFWGVVNVADSWKYLFIILIIILSYLFRIDFFARMLCLFCVLSVISPSLHEIDLQPFDSVFSLLVSFFIFNPPVLREKGH